MNRLIYPISGPFNNEKKNKKIEEASKANLGDMIKAEIEEKESE